MSKYIIEIRQGDIQPLKELLGYESNLVPGNCIRVVDDKFMVWATEKQYKKDNGFIDYTWITSTTYLRMRGESTQESIDPLVARARNLQWD